MRKKLLSAFVVFALAVSMTISDTLLAEGGWSLLTKGFAEGDGGDPDDPDFEALEVRFYHNGVYVGEKFNHYVKPGDKITVRAGSSQPQRDAEGKRLHDAYGNDLNKFIPDPSAVIYYTDNRHVDESGKPFKIAEQYALGQQRVGNSQQAPSYTKEGLSTTVPEGYEIGTATYITNRVFSRHFGGFIPEVESNNNHSKRFPLANGLIVPDFDPAFMEVYTISVVAYRGTEEYRDTQSFLIEPPTGDMEIIPLVAEAQGNSNRLMYAARKKNLSDNDFLIFSVYADAQKLFDYYEGILVPGVDRGDWSLAYQALNPTGLAGNRPDGDGKRTRPDYVAHDMMEPFAPTLPANFNRSGRPAEVEAHIEVFDPSGVRLAGEGGGMRVKGGWSRGTNLYEQRTFEFYFRNEYTNYTNHRGETNRISFPLFGEQHSDDGSGNLITRYRRFRVRNGGSDRDRSHLRDELAGSLFKQAGILLTQKFRPAVVYLNGGYYGFTFMKMPRTENQWMRELGGNSDNYEMIQNGERATVGCTAATESCGRVIPGFTASVSGTSYVCDNCGYNVGPWAATSEEREHYTGQNGKQCRISTRNWSGMPLVGGNNPTGHGANRYQDFGPPVCSASRPCADEAWDGIPGIEDRRATCAQWHKSEGDFCGAVHIAKCYKNKAAYNPAEPGKTQKVENGILTNGIYGECTGCRASCDFADIIRLVEGQQCCVIDPVSGQPILSGGAVQDLGRPNTGTSSTAIRMNLNGFPQNDVGQKRWDEFKKRMDVDYLMHYYAMNIWTANEDWPGNNIEWWRYFPDKDENGKPENPNELHPYIGKAQWRPVPQDLEMGFNIWFQNRGTSFENDANSATAPGYNTFRALFNRGVAVGTESFKHYGANNGNWVMRGLLGDREVTGHSNGTQAEVNPVSASEMRTKLANAYVDLMENGGARSETVTLANFNVLQKRIEGEHQVALQGGNGPITGGYQDMTHQDTTKVVYRRISEIHRSTTQTNAGAWLWPGWLGWEGKPDGVTDDHNAIKTFLEKRNAGIIKGLNSDILNRGLDSGAKTWAGARGMTVSLTVSGDGGYAIMNTRPIGMKNLEPIGATPDPRSVTSVSANYFADAKAPIPLQAKPYPGYVANWSGSVTPSGDPNLVFATGDCTVTLTFTKTDEALKAAGRAFEVKSVKNSDPDRGWTVNGLGDRTERPPTVDQGFVEIHNNTSKTVSTRGMYLTDSAGNNNLKNRFIYQMPSLIIPAGKSVYFQTNRNGNSTVYVKGEAPNYTSTTSYYKKRSNMGFNLDPDDRLYLYNAKGELQQMVDVTVTDGDQVQLRDNDGKFRIHNFTSGSPVAGDAGIVRWIGRTVPAPRPATMPCVGGCGAVYPAPCTCCDFCGFKDCKCTPCPVCGFQPADCICCKYCGKIPDPPTPRGLGLCDCPRCPGVCGKTIYYCDCSPFITTQGGGEFVINGPGTIPPYYTITALGNVNQQYQWRINASFRVEGGALNNWALTTSIPVGMSMATNGGNYEMIGFGWTQTANQYWGLNFNVNATTGLLTITPNQDVIRNIADNATGTLSFVISSPNNREDVVLSRPCDHTYGAWVQSTTNCAQRTRSCTKCGTTQSDNNGTHTRNTPTNCRQCTVCGATGLIRTCTPAAPCGYCQNVISCTGCGQEGIQHGPCPTATDGHLTCNCTCGPRVVGSGGGVQIEGATVTVLGAQTMNEPNGIRISGLNVGPQSGGRWIDINFPFPVSKMNHWNITTTSQGNGVWRLTFPEWWAENSFEVGFTGG